MLNICLDAVGQRARIDEFLLPTLEFGKNVLLEHCLREALLEVIALLAESDNILLLELSCEEEVIGVHRSEGLIEHFTLLDRA